MNRATLIPRIKLLVLLLFAVLSVVLILQNTQAVTTRLLFVTVGMPLAALLALTLLIGFAGGVLAAMKVDQQRRPSQKVRAVLCTGANRPPDQASIGSYPDRTDGGRQHRPHGVTH